MESGPLLLLLCLLPLVGAAVVAAVPARAAEAAKRLAVAVALATLAVAVVVALRFDRGADAPYQLADRYDWIPQFGVSLSLGVTGISVALVALTAVLVPLCLLASWDDGRASSRRPQTHLALMLALEGLILAAFCARDVFLFYVCFEVMLIPMYFLIGGYGGAQRSYAAAKFLIYNLLGGLVMLAALIGLYVESRGLPGAEDGTFDITTLATQLELGTTTERLLFLGFFLAFAIKAPLWPLHTWLPDAAVEARPGAAVLMVSVMDKLGTFGMIALCLPLFPAASVWARPVVVALAVVGIVYGALVAIGQSDLMRLIAYTSVSHFGFIIMGIFAMTSQGQTGATLYMVNHGFSTAGLFLIAGMMVTRRGSRLIADYGGVQRVAPVLAGSFFVAGLSSLALPGLSSFVSEFLVLVGTFTRYQAAAVVATLGIVLAALYILLTVTRTLSGPVRPETEGFRDLRGREAAVVAPVLAVIIALGFVPGPLIDVIDHGVDDTLASVSQDDPAPSVPAAPVAEGSPE
ncbi:NADH-quinone oxidoreductase subunit M [Vallicoccus soli]|uniref:NADH-quinone oxidoreductase subunit M n=1 Tax=Vallicoccus soli TaxID=2339232 RepID=A0A3A3YZL1_9ACTN|nr:NADH-quinone oxidoreductase subunit M [Vallicoccus soli]